MGDWHAPALPNKRFDQGADGADWVRGVFSLYDCRISNQTQDMPCFHPIETSHQFIG